MAPYRILTASGDEIDALLRSAEPTIEEAHCLASPRWLSVLSQVYKVKTTLFLAQTAEGKAIASLPTYYSPHSGCLFGLRHGLQAENADAAAGLIQAAKRFAAAEGLVSIDLGLAAAPGLVDSAAVVETASFEFNLAACRTEDDLWRLFSGHGRRSLRAALRSGQELRSGRQELPTAVALYQSAMRQKLARVHSSAFIEQIATTFEERFVPIVCYEAQQPLAAAFLLIGDRMGAYLYGGSSKRSLQLQSGSLLYFEMMRQCMGNGLERLDAGESSPGSGTFEFKRRLGARQTSVRYLRETVDAPSTLSARIRHGRRSAADLAQRILLKAYKLVGRQAFPRSAITKRRII